DVTLCFCKKFFFQEKSKRSHAVFSLVFYIILSNIVYFLNFCYQSSEKAKLEKLAQSTNSQ
ncbi:MAG: hypothetical protein V2B14_05970, partial [bacterium]